MSDNTQKVGEFTGQNCAACSSPMKWKENKKTGGVFAGCIRFPFCNGQKPKSTGGGTIKLPEQNDDFGNSNNDKVIQTNVLMDIMQKNILTKVSTDLKGFETRLEECLIEIEDAYSEQLKNLKNALQPSSIEWKVNDKVIAKIEGKHHKAINALMVRIKANMKNMLVVGPAGSGKTTLAADLSRALNLSFGSLSCSGGMPEWYLTGRSIPDLSTGKNKYQVSPFINIYENGGIFLLDEVDAADPNVMIVINSALANGYMNIPAREDNPIAYRHKDCFIVAAANTFGRGADLQYVGRNPLDAATLDRFAGAIVTVDYDKDLERQLVPEENITSLVWDMRERAEKLKIRRIIGTRSLLAVAALVRSGETFKSSIEAIVVGWTQDEITKVIPNIGNL